MARLSTYAIDGTPVSSDKLIGTDSAGTVTKNYPLGDVADWLKSSGATGILGQNNYTFQIAIDPNEGRKLGAFSFENYGGDGTAFSAVTTLRFSAYSSAGQNVAEYINTTVGGRVILGQLDDLNSFGVYVLTSFIQNQSEPTFYDANLVFVKGNGNLRGEKTYGLATYSDVSSSGGINTLKIGTSSEEGLTDVLKSVFDGADKETKLRLSTNKFEVSGTSITRSGTNPVVRLVADNADNPSFGETMGTLRFTRNFEDPLALDLARAIYADFSERVTNDGGTVEGTEECVAAELELIVSGEYLINMVDIKPEYTGALASTKADLVISINNGSGTPTEKLRITKDGNVEIKDPLAGVVIRSRNDTPYRILVDNDGRLEATALDAAAPVINGVPTISGIAAITETITVTKASVASSPALTTTYQWQVSDTVTGGWSNISGATSASYLIPLEYANKFLRAQQIETNILGQTIANSASTTAVIPSVLVSAMIQRLDNFENETYVYDSLVDFDAIELS